MKDFIKTIKRYRVFLLLELAAIIILDYAFYRVTYNPLWSTMALSQDYMINGAQLTREFLNWNSIKLLATVNGFVTVFILVFATFIRYVIYDGKNRKLINASFPLRIREKTVHELLLGVIPITIAALFAGTAALLNNFDYVQGGYTVWHPQFNLAYVQLACLNWIVGIDLYVYFVFAKRVASSNAGLVLNYFVISFLALVAFAFYFDNYGNVFSGYLYDLVGFIAFLIPLGLSLAGLFIADRKLDISKGGLFYFKTIHVIVSILSGLAFFVWMYGYLEIYLKGDTVAHAILAIAISIAISAGVFFLTRARKA